MGEHALAHLRRLKRGWHSIKESYVVFFLIWFTWENQLMFT